MAFLEIVSSDIDPEVTEIYNKICELPPNKYKKDKAVYESYLESRSIIQKLNRLRFL